MNWSYEDGLPTDKDMVRFLVGDINSSDKLVSDDAIEMLLASLEDVYQAAAMICDSLVSRFARVSTITIDGFTVKGADRAEQFRTQAANLRRTSANSAAGALGVPFVGGATVSDVEAAREDTSRVQPKFEVGQDDFPGSPIPQPRYSDMV